MEFSHMQAIVTEPSQPQRCVVVCEHQIPASNKLVGDVVVKFRILRTSQKHHTALHLIVQITSTTNR